MGRGNFKVEDQSYYQIDPPQMKVVSKKIVALKGIVAAVFLAIGISAILIATNTIKLKHVAHLKEFAELLQKNKDATIGLSAILLFAGLVLSVKAIAGGYRRYDAARVQIEKEKVLQPHKPNLVISKPVSYYPKSGEAVKNNDTNYPVEVVNRLEELTKQGNCYTVFLDNEKICYVLASGKMGAYCQICKSEEEIEQSVSYLKSMDLDFVESPKEEDSHELKLSEQDKGKEELVVTQDKQTISENNNEELARVLEEKNRQMEATNLRLCDLKKSKVAVEDKTLARKVAEGANQFGMRVFQNKWFLMISHEVSFEYLVLSQALAQLCLAKLEGYTPITAPSQKDLLQLNNSEL